MLVVDDEPMVRDTLGQVLTDEGYVVDLATDGETALDRLHSARPDAILLDLMMPGMNGRQFLQSLRGSPEYEKVPVLIMTAVHGLNVNLAALGASEVVEKPFDVDELLNKVALLVHRSRDANPQPPTPAVAPPVAPAPDQGERGVVLVVERDRARMQTIDMLLSTRGYTVVSMTRAPGQLSRLVRALQPRALLLDLASDGFQEVMRELREAKDLGEIPLLVFSRGLVSGIPPSIETLEHATDLGLVGFVEKQR